MIIQTVGQTGSDMLSKSGAQVKVYAGDTLLATYNVPYNVEGTLWHVFDYDAATDVLTPVNEMTYSRMPDTSVLIRRSLELEQLYQSGSPEELKDYEIEEQNAAGSGYNRERTERTAAGIFCKR